MSIIYNRIGNSGGKLAFLLGCSVFFPNPDNNEMGRSWTHSKKRKGVIPRAINLGCRKKRIRPEHANCFNYNSETSCNKVKSFSLFDKFSINHPKLLSIEDIKAGNVPAKFLGRKNKSSSGQGIKLYTLDSWQKELARNPGKIEENDFYVEFLECKSEHRIHVFGDTVLCELNKRIRDNGKFIHTLAEGSPLILGRINHPQRDLMIDYSIKAVKSCGLDFGAVDIFVDKNDKVYILEVNSDPGMPGIIGFIYADHFRKIFNMSPPSHYKINDKGEIVKPDGTDFVQKIKQDLKNRKKFIFKSE